MPDDNEYDNDDDDVTRGSLGKGSGPTAPVTTGEGTEESKGFEMVDDGEEAPIAKVMISIPAKDVARPEGSGQTGKDLLFESEEEDKAEVQKQIKAALDSAGPLGDLILSEDDLESDSESSDSNDDGEDQDQEDVTADPPSMPDRSRSQDGPNPGAPSKDILPAIPAATKGKGPSSEDSGKAPTPKIQLSSAAPGVQEHVQSTLFGVAALAQAIASEEDTVCRLENYTGLLTGLQKLVGTMASGYEAATEDIRSLVASTLDRLMQDQLACWDQVWEAGITLSRKITTLTSEHEESTASGEIFRTLLPACFQHVRVRTKATFAELKANLPSLLCRFVTPDQAGHILAFIFTCLCNYNTEICGMAMAQTVVPVYTIPNTYRVQQSLWESMCRIIPGIAHTSGNEPCSVMPAALDNTVVGQSGTVPDAGNSSSLGTGTAGLSNPQSLAASSTHGKGTTQETRPIRIPPADSKWAFFHNFVLTVNLTNNGEPTDTMPQGTSTPIKATPVLEGRLSGKKLNASKIKASHLLFDMQDWQERARKSVEAENQAVVSDRTPGKDHGFGGGLSHGLPAMLPNLPSGLTPGSSQRGTK